ncbi:gag protein [Colletotrichum asianum]
MIRNLRTLSATTATDKDISPESANSPKNYPRSQYYDDNYQIHLSNKENSGYYPPKPKTLAIMHASNSKIARKPAEPLNKMLQIQRLEPITSHITPQQSHHEEQQIQREIKIIQQEDARQAQLRQQEESKEEPEHQHNPLTKQQLLSITSN